MKPQYTPETPALPTESPSVVVSEEFYRPSRSIKRWLVPTLWSVGGVVFMGIVLFGSYVFYEHLINGYSYEQIVSSGIPLVSSSGNSLSAKVPADRPARSTGGSGNSSTPGTSDTSQGSTSTNSPSTSVNGGSTSSGSLSTSDSSGATSSALGCLSQPSVCGYPDATNTGVPVGTKLTPHAGHQVIKADNTVIDGWDTGRIDIYANNVVIKNTRITTSSYYGVYVYSGSVTVEDATITGQATSSQECDAGVTGATLVLRTNISGCEDGVHLSGHNGVEDTYIHDPYFTSSSHNDGIQVFSASGSMMIKHNTIVMTNPGGSRQANSCVFVQPTSGSVDGVTIDSNLVDGGGYTLYIEQSTNVSLSHNRIGRDYKYGWFSHAHNTNMPLLTDNVWDDTGQPIN